MRLSDSERDDLYEQLKRHSALGRLTIEELERRVALVAQAETHAEAAEALADLPALPPAPAPPAQRPGLAKILRPRGHAETDAPAPDWRPTGERFRDPRSGRVMRVWIDGGGARHYVPETP